MAATIHDRLVARLRELGAAVFVDARTDKYTVLRLDKKLARAANNELTMIPSDRARYWFVGRGGALRYKYNKPTVAGSLSCNSTTIKWLLDTAPANVPKSEPRRRLKPHGRNTLGFPRY